MDVATKANDAAMSEASAGSAGNAFVFTATVLIAPGFTTSAGMMYRRD